VARLPDHDITIVSSPAAGINEQQLFHGTSAGAAAAISQEGFDFRLNSNYSFGVGNYFSDNSYTALQYSKAKEAPGSSRSHSGAKMLTLLVARVLLGRQCEGKHGLKRAPDGFDSVHASHQQPNVPGRYHVIFDNSSAYPDYVITLQR
jgi:hypothetical protein